MVDMLTLELVDRQLVTNSISLNIGYADDKIKSTGGTMKIDEYTNSYKKLWDNFSMYFEKTTNKKQLIRRINIGFNNVIDSSFTTISLFTDVLKDKREQEIQTAILRIKSKYGKNAILKGMSLQEKATAQSRNKLVGGHNGE